MSVDPKVYELAVFYLSDEPDLNTEAARITLADVIQQAIEDEIIFMRTMMQSDASNTTKATIANTSVTATVGAKGVST